MLVTRENISTIEQKLPRPAFVRIHRSFIVNIRYLTTFSSEGVALGATELPFGRAYRKSAMAILAMKNP
jgi:DNA-binding LytR/AlgR family response regulator